MGHDSAAAPTYRERVYRSYVSAFKGEPTEQDLEAHARFFDHLLAPLVEKGLPERVVEVGCGPGTFLFWARRKGIPHVEGFDLAVEQVEVARRFGLPARLGSYREILGSLSTEPDLVVALDLIEHLDRDEVFELLDLVHTVLAPNGRLFLTTPNGAALRPGPTVFGDLTHETVFTPRSIAVALRLAGFSAIQIREVAPPRDRFRSRVRGFLWQLLRLAPLFVDLVESGSSQGGVYSRVMAVEAMKVERRS
ncbi:MAG TPA: class I SAM-dependent methyltransferase [Thermoanaerobaculia bacterium]|nr:class I SAM-dependent methyltransferase [Thermoanaerobaculia bacterium]